MQCVPLADNFVVVVCLSARLSRSYVGARITKFSLSQISYTGEKIDHEKSRYPNSIVWTPIPVLTWIFPFIGHMGIAMTNGTRAR